MAGPSAEESDGPLQSAAERLRQAARWLVVAFGAVAAVVFAGIGFSDLTRVQVSTWQFWVALVGAGLAVIGLLASLLRTMALASASAVSVHDLAAERPDEIMSAVLVALGSNPALAKWEGDVAAFFDDVRAANDEYVDNLVAWRDNRSEAASMTDLNHATEYLKALRRIQSAIMAEASYLRLRQSFERARWRLAGALLLSTLGALTFVIAIGAGA